MLGLWGKAEGERGNLLSVQNPHAYIIGLQWICRELSSQIDKGVQTALNNNNKQTNNQRVVSVV